MSYAEFLNQKRQHSGAGGFAPRYRPTFLYDFQSLLVDWATTKGRAAIFADCGLGKALASETPVLTPTGWQSIGALKPGDMVVGRNGRATNVIGVFPQGTRRLYRVTLSDGVTVKSDAEHLWAVQTQLQRYRGNRHHVMTTAQLAACQLIDQVGRSRYFIPVADAAQFGHSGRLPIDPYLLGVLLGDGNLATSGTSITITSADELLVRSCLLPDGVRIVQIIGDGTRTPTYRLSTAQAGTGHRNPLFAALESYGLLRRYAHEKFVPLPYRFASIADRLAILQGLLDTDGYGNADGVLQFVSTSERLARDVVGLVQSLGGTARTSTRVPSYRGRDGERLTGRRAWTATIRLPRGVIPFRLKRKVASWRQHTSYTPCRSIRSIEPIDKADATCIAVDADDSLFVAEHHVVTHNTPMQLVWAQNVVEHTNRPVLILTPLAVSSQTIREAKKFQIPCSLSRTGTLTGRAEIVVTNYEQLHRFSPNDFAGTVCDESGILKNFDGVTKAAITEFMRCMSYRLLCTATAAPNDYIELGTSSEAIGELGYVDMLSMFFKNDEGSIAPLSYATKWRFKPHAARPFWEWLCSWARALRRPSDLNGCDDGPFQLPPLCERVTVIESARPSPGMLFVKPASNLREQRVERRATIRERCECVARLMASHDRPFLSWCHLNDEGDLLEALMPDALQVSGSDSDEAKVEKFDAFTSGQSRGLITKPRIGGFGMNWQHCADMSLFLSHSYEQYYQSIRRCWRYGQVRPVNVDIISTEGEGDVLGNLKRKSAAADEMFSEMVAAMGQARMVRAAEYVPVPVSVPSWVEAACNRS